MLSYLAMNASEAGGDVALIQTSLLFSFKCQLGNIRKLDLHNKNSEICIETRSPPASLPFIGQVTKQTTVKWSIRLLPHPWGIFRHKTIKLRHISEKTTACHPQKQICEEIDHFEEVIHPKKRPKHTVLFVNDFKPPGVPCIFW